MPLASLHPPLDVFSSINLSNAFGEGVNLILHGFSDSHEPSGASKVADAAFFKKTKKQNFLRFCAILALISPWQSIWVVWICKSCLLLMSPNEQQDTIM